MDELLAKYILDDGAICSLSLEVDYTSASNSPHRQASVEVLIRKKLLNDKWEPCRLQIHFIGIQKIVINEEFSSFYYSDIVFRKEENGMWYLSLDPYTNLGEPHEEDNLVIVAHSVSIEERAI